MEKHDRTHPEEIIRIEEGGVQEKNGIHTLLRNNFRKLNQKPRLEVERDLMQ